MLTGLIPLITITVIARNHLLRQNLADSVNANKLLITIEEEKVLEISENIKIQTDTNESFTLNTNTHRELMKLKKA